MKEFMRILKNDRDNILYMSYYIARGIKKLYISSILDFKNEKDLLKNKEYVYNFIDFLIPKDEVLEISSCVPLPFVIDASGLFGKFCLVCGLCSHRWVIEILEWLYSGEAPEHLFDAIIGMLCGYDSSSIEKYVETRVRNEFKLKGK